MFTLPPSIRLFPRAQGKARDIPHESPGTQSQQCGEASAQPVISIPGPDLPWIFRRFDRAGPSERWSVPGLSVIYILSLYVFSVSFFGRVRLDMFVQPVLFLCIVSVIFGILVLSIFVLSSFLIEFKFSRMVVFRIHFG
jgi:hypothetical protein